MIILRPWAHYRAFIVVVVLIPHIPIKPVMQLDCQPRFRRLKTHGIRRDQRSRPTSRIGDATPLPSVLVDSIRCKQRRTWSNAGNRFYEEIVVPYVIQAEAKRMLYAIEEIVDHRLAVYPMEVVAGADRKIGTSRPID